MIEVATITFPDRDTEKRALALLIEHRFSGRVVRGGKHYLPAAALLLLAEHDIPFALEDSGSETNERR